MFERILIANRGEIACRIIRTARRLGVETVAVYSDADAGAMHVAMADAAVRIGPPAAAESYLQGARIVEAALASGAQAIHPGYGFLSENPDFVDAVTAAGLVFIGPSAAAIRAMGLKDAAKALMVAAGVPVVPGYHGPDQDDALLAERLRYRLSGADQGGGGRRRQGHAPGRRAARFRGGPRRGAERGGIGLRQRRRAGREIRHRAAAYRDPGVRRQSRQRGASVRARLLAATPASEGDRGGPGAGHDRGDARRDGDRRRQRGEGDRLFGRRHRGVHRRRGARPPSRRLLVHGDEHPAAGRASRHRGDHRARIWWNGSCASPPASGCRSARPRSPCAATPSRRGSTPRTPRGASCPRPGS